MVPINYFAVLVAAIASIILGSLWFGPLFGKRWMKLMGISADDMKKGQQSDMKMSYGLMSLGSLVMAFVMAHSMTFAMAYLKLTGIEAGLQGGWWNWLGFMAPIIMGDQLWGGKSWKLFPIVGGYYLVSLCMMGVILAMWPAM